MTLDELAAAFDSSVIELPKDFWKELGKTMAANQAILAEEARNLVPTDEDWRRVYGTIPGER